MIPARLWPLLAGSMLLSALCGSVSSGQSLTSALTECGVEGNVRIFCGLDTPEDLIRVPGTEWLIASAVHAIGIHVLDVHDHSTVQLFPRPDSTLQLDRARFPGCPGPLGPEQLAKFDSHGLALRRLGPGRFVLYAVHHTNRESIEVFALDARGATPRATWVGCVPAPAGVNLNAVVALSDGGIIASNFIPGDWSLEVPLVMAGKISGDLWEWHLRSGWARVPGSQSSGANGVEISADERWIYFNAWGAQTVVRLSRGLAKPQRTEIPMGFRPDNVHWSSDGTLLDAGQTERGYRIVKIDPRSLQVTVLLDQPDSAMFLRGTVAAQVGAQYWVGSSRAHAVAVFYDPR